jgi:hypothetical protein
MYYLSDLRDDGWLGLVCHSSVLSDIEPQDHWAHLIPDQSPSAPPSSIPPMDPTYIITSDEPIPGTILLDGFLQSFAQGIIVTQTFKYWVDFRGEDTWKKMGFVLVVGSLVMYVRVFSSILGGECRVCPFARDDGLPLVLCFGSLQTVLEDYKVWRLTRDAGQWVRTTCCNFGIGRLTWA